MARLIFEHSNFRLDVVVLLLQAGEFRIPIIGLYAAEVPILFDLLARERGLEFADFLVDRGKLRLQPCDLIVI